MLENNQKKDHRKNVKHGLRNHRLYYVWSDMKKRCFNEKRSDYKYYGGRGITVCDEWLDINNFINDMYPSFQEGLTLDRERVNENYSKDNCRWANRNTQARNTQILRADNKSGYRGVGYDKKLNKFRCYITINGKVKHLGVYKTALEAVFIHDKYITDNGLEHTRNFN